MLSIILIMMIYFVADFRLPTFPSGNFHYLPPPAQGQPLLKQQYIIFCGISIQSNPEFISKISIQMVVQVQKISTDRFRAVGEGVMYRLESGTRKWRHYIRCQFCDWWYNYYIACCKKVMDRRQDKNKNLTKRAEDIKYCRAIKEFLETFKTSKCTIEAEHRLQTCRFYHSPADRRRNPYNNGTFLYYLDTKCHCQNPKCVSYHSNYEYSYHPLVYKNINCTRNGCDLPPLYCWMIHKGEHPYFEQGEFFRFDIATFKTIKCARTDLHERKTCLGYHKQKDKRRPEFNNYSHIPCPKSNCNCQRSHNKIQQLYHPTRYKTKFCQYFNKDAMACEYHDFCSFAHTKDEILIPLIDPDNKDPNYIISIYKTVWCPYTQDHDRGECPYAHNIQDYRRKPSQHKYKPQKCPNWDFSNKIQSIELSKCPAGMNCTMCHGWMQHRYHPLIYKSKGVSKSFVKKDQYLQKKLTHPKEGAQKKEKESNIQAIVNKEIQSNKASIFTVGAPFFKHEREEERQASEGSKQTKPKTGNQSNLGSQKSFNSCRKGSVVDQPKSKKVINSMFFHFDEHKIWECDSVQNSKSRNSDGRSKSQGTSNQAQTPYSRSIKEFINNNSIIEKLERQKVNEISLINMTDKKINDMEVLTRDQKEILLRNLKKYSLKSCLKNIEYSRNLTYFFSINNAQQLLTKLQQRFVKESSLVKLTKQAVRDLSFLDGEEKEVLPKLLKSYQKFSEEKQFQRLLCDVNNWVKNRSQAAQEK